MASKIKKPEWIALYAITGLIDVFQIGIDLFLTEFLAAPEAINEVIDVALGIGLVIYFQIRGVSVFGHMGRFASMIGMEALTDITGGAASLWILEIWYMRKTVRQEEAETGIAQQEQEALAIGASRQPAYRVVDGVPMRPPALSRDNDSGPKNRLNGIRPPEGALSSSGSATIGKVIRSDEQSFST